MPHILASVLTLCLAAGPAPESALAGECVSDEPRLVAALLTFILLVGDRLCGLETERTCHFTAEP